jgi:hypothetical protein
MGQQGFNAEMVLKPGPALGRKDTVSCQIRAGQALREVLGLSMAKIRLIEWDVSPIHTSPPLRNLT